MQGNIVLVGMPGSGKTTIAKMVSELTGRRMFDTDEEVQKFCGKTIREIFESDGEAHFRDLETEVIKRVSAVSDGRIIATGGGAVLRGENVEALKRTGRVVYISRPLSMLEPSPDRPLADSREKLNKLEFQRLDCYLDSADYLINAEKSPEDAADTLVKLIKGQCRRTAVFEPSSPEGEITAPPSKSMTHRMLIMASLSEGTSVVSNYAENDDVLATADCLGRLGAEFHAENGTVSVIGTDIFEKKQETELFCRESGSTLRFLIPLCLLSGEKFVLSGEKNLMDRPVSVYEDICREKGYLFDRSGGSITVRGPLEAGEYTVRGDVSSQFVSGLLMALPLLEADSTIHILPPVTSRPYIDMTIAAMKEFGVRASWKDENTIEVPGGQKYMAKDVTVEGDWTNAAYFHALGVTVKGLDPNSLQGDRICVELMDRLRKGYCEIDLSDNPDLGPLLFAYAAMNHGARFTGISRLRYKESDRVAAMKEELEGAGATFLSSEDEVEVRPGVIQPGLVQSHGDHRIAMSMSVLAAYAGGHIMDAEAVSKSYPDFFEELRNCNVRVRENIGFDYISSTVCIGNVTVPDVFTRKPRIVASVCGTDIPSVIGNLKKCRGNCDMAELRADFFVHVGDRDELLELLKKCRETLGDIPLIFTLRTSGEGGRVSLDDHEYEAINLWAAGSGCVDAIDLEVLRKSAVLPRLLESIHGKGIPVIGSCHDFEKTPPEDVMVSDLVSIDAKGADIAKVSVMPKSREDVFSVLRVCEKARRIIGKSVTAISMSENGVITRICAGAFGSDLAYGYSGAPAAPGQIEAGELGRLIKVFSGPARFGFANSIYEGVCYGLIGERTDLLCLLGDPVIHSKSPFIHNTSFGYLGLDMRYLPFRVDRYNLKTAVDGLRRIGVRGWNLTMPVKTAMVPLCDELSPEAELCGSVNTVVNRNGKLFGTSTDGIGWIRSAAEAGVDIKGRKLVILGSGGAGKSVISACAVKGAAKIDIFRRKNSKWDDDAAFAEKVSSSTECAVSLHDISDLDDLRRCLDGADILVNATSVGMSVNPGCLIPDPGYLHEGLVVSDMIYEPEETELLRMAREEGLMTVGGEGMLLYQAAESFRNWTGQEMPLDIVREKLSHETKESIIEYNTIRIHTGDLDYGYKDRTWKQKLRDWFRARHNK